MAGAKTIITNIGKIKIAKAAETGIAVAVRYFAVGDGNGETYIPDGTEATLRDEKWRSGINSSHVNPLKLDELILDTVIPANIGGFYIREYATFDVDGDMISIGTCLEIYKPSMDDHGPLISIECLMSHTLQNMASLELTVDLKSYVTYEYLLRNNYKIFGSITYEQRPQCEGSAFALMTDIAEAKLPDVYDDGKGTVLIQQPDGSGAKMIFATKEQPKVYVSIDGASAKINMYGGGIEAFSQAGAKTAEVIAEDGTVIFANGSFNIDSVGKVYCSQQIHVNGYYGQLMLDLVTNNAPELNEITNEEEANGIQGLKFYGGGGAKQGAVIRGYDSNGEGSGLTFTGSGHDSMVIYEKDGTEISSVGMIAGGTLPASFTQLVIRNPNGVVKSIGKIKRRNKFQPNLDAPNAVDFGIYSDGTNIYLGIVGGVNGMRFAPGEARPRNQANGAEFIDLLDITSGIRAALFSNVAAKGESAEIRLINSSGTIGITNEDQTSWLARITKDRLSFDGIGPNVFSANGRPVFNGSTGATIADLVNYEPLLNFTPVQQGTGVGQLTNVVKIGYDGQGRVLITIDATNMGAIVTDTYLNAGTLPIYGSTVSAESLMTATHIVVNGVKDWGAGRVSSMFMHATYVRGLAKDTGFDMDSGDRPKVEGVAGDSRVAVLQDLQNLSIILDEGCQFVYGGGDQCYVGIGFCNVLTVTND